MMNHGQSLKRTPDLLVPMKRGSRRGPVFKKMVASAKTSRPRTPEVPVCVVIPTAARDVAQTVNVEERDSAYTVVMGLSGIDPRAVSVLARPHSLLIELNVNDLFRHQLVTGQAVEIVHQSVSREFRFPSEIERGS